MRLFVAIPVPQETSRELGEAVARMRTWPCTEGLRWSPPESWHITLQFLGNAATQQYSCVVERLRQIRIKRVEIVPEGIGTFERVGILYAGVKRTSKLDDLERLVTAATGPCGFFREERLYRPHITLARKRGHMGRQGITATARKNQHSSAFQIFTCSEFVLYESFLGADVRYEIRERFPLGL
jgi:RNA 2',3'-cyclic 3'-phosphodiesterase